MKRHKRFSILDCVVLFVCTISSVLLFCADVSATSTAGTDSLTDTSSSTKTNTRYTAFLFPRNPSPWQISFAADASMTILPRIIVEESVRTIPMLGASFRMGLPWNFGLHARLRTILLSNFFALGLSWSYSVGDVSFAIHNNFGMWAGFSGILEGFDSNAGGPLGMSGLSAGVQIGEKTLLTARADAVLSFGYSLNIGSTRILRRTAAFRGVEGMLCLEQQLSSGGRLFAGLKTAYSRPSYEAWAAFSDIESFLFYPTIFFGYAF